MQYRLVGNTMPAVEVLFDSPGESMYTQSGGMAWMTEGIRMDTNTKGGLLKGVGRFICLLTCIGETNFKSSDLSVQLTCVPNQWINYQLFISQIKRAYYLDVPGKYNELNNRFPKIHVKEFGDFFHESNNLID